MGFVGGCINWYEVNKEDLLKVKEWFGVCWIVTERERVWRLLFHVCRPAPVTLLAPQTKLVIAYLAVKRQNVAGC